MANYTETFTSVNGDVTDATELEGEFDAIATAIATKIDADGSGTMTGALNMGSNLINNVTDPASDQDAATRKFIEDNFGYGLAASDELLIRLATHTTIPTGWTISSVDNKAVKITGNEAASADGGSVSFSAALVNAHATLIATEAAHTHSQNGSSDSLNTAGGSQANVISLGANTGAGTAHRHSITIGVQHRDFHIIVKS